MSWSRWRIETPDAVETIDGRWLMRRLRQLKRAGRLVTSVREIAPHRISADAVTDRTASLILGGLILAVLLLTIGEIIHA